jgi:probable phosphoglycerate mutase
MTDPTPQAPEPHLTRLGLDVMMDLAGAPRLEPRARAFLFLRHGATAGNVDRIYQHPDIELNAMGLAQARDAAALLRGRPIERIQASTMARAWRTAEIVGEAVGRPPTPEPRLRERYFGDLIGTPSTNLNWAYDPPNGERLHDFVLRTREGLLAALDSDASTLVVAHGGTLYVLAFSLGINLGMDHLHNANPLAFRQEDGRWRVDLLDPRPREGAPLGGGMLGLS